MTGFAFSPQFTTISAGDSVQWRNLDTVTHTSTANSSDPQTWNFASVAPGATTATVTLNTPGTYDYICTIHFSADKMWGRIIVTGSGVPEFSSSLLVVVGMLGIVVGLMVLRRKS